MSLPRNQQPNDASRTDPPPPKTPAVVPAEAPPESTDTDRDSGFNIPPGVDPDTARDPGNQTPAAPKTDNRSGRG
ncbi:hypothetical protein RBI14_06315 [Alcaligenaceae bacterium B3P038]|nr:hypothetical protein [Alcaligenaceae bacterium B3P038]